MALNLEPRVRQALIEVVSQALARGQDVTLPGFGTLRTRHAPAEIRREGAGYALMPPRRSVDFDADSDIR